MSAEDALAESLWIGAIASESGIEEADLKTSFKIFGKPFLDQMRSDDVHGLLVSTVLFRNGKMLSSGMLLVLKDRILIGWMKGMFKKPVVEAVALSDINDVERNSKTPPRLDKVKEVITVSTPEDEWLIACSPAVSPDAPLYKMLVDLLNGEQTADKLPGPSEGS